MAGAHALDMDKAIKSIRDAAVRHRGGKGFGTLEDDATLIVMEFLGSDKSNRQCGHRAYRKVGPR